MLLHDSIEELIEVSTLLEILVSSTRRLSRGRISVSTLLEILDYGRDGKLCNRMYSFNPS